MSQFVVTKMRHCSALVHTNAHAVPSVHAASVMAVAIVPCVEYEEARAGAWRHAIVVSDLGLDLGVDVPCC